MNTTAGKLVIISGPSGAGKSTVVGRLLETCSLPLELSVSATTRPPRQGEVDGVHYHFLTHDEFQRRQARNDFLESEEVFAAGHWYGTLRDDVNSRLAKGKWVVLEIDVAGARSVLKQVPDAITLFIHPGSLDELEKRLRLRGTEDEESRERRLRTARHEMTFVGQYSFEVINDSVDRAVAEICEILKRSGG